MSDSCIEWHGWDSTSSAWYGPDELSHSLAGCRSILARLRRFSGSWYGRLGAQAPDGLPLSLFASVHDLGDTGLAALDLEGVAGGPLEVVLVAPPVRRPKLRAELAFEFASYLRFLEGAQSSGRELALYEYIERVLTEPAGPNTLVFSIETRPMDPDVQFLISEQAERLVMSMVAWMAEKDAPGRPERATRARAAGIAAGVLQ